MTPEALRKKLEEIISSHAGHVAAYYMDGRKEKSSPLIKELSDLILAYGKQEREGAIHAVERWVGIKLDNNQPIQRADASHSALLRRLLVEKKPALPKPPPKKDSYPIYPDAPTKGETDGESS